MKKTLLLLALAFTLFSCKSTNNLFGTYSKKGKGYYYELILNSDSTFSYINNYGMVSPQCKGIWKMTSKDTIQLLCNEEENILATISAGYMNDRQPIILIKGKRLKSGNVVMKKQ